MTESRDSLANGVGDHDEPYIWDHHWTPDDFQPFTLIVFSRLMVLRSRIKNGLTGMGDMESGPWPVLAGLAEDPSTFSPSD